MSAPASKIGAVDVDDDVRPRSDQVLVAAFERRAAEIGGREVALLQHGAHGAVEHEDTLAKGVKKGLASDLMIFHE